MPSSSRRGLLARRAALSAGGAALAALGAAGGVAGTRYRDTHLSPTARVAPRPSGPGRMGTRVLFQGDPGSGQVSVTFDDGPDARWTPMVLEMLARHEVPATFFVLGQAAQRHPDLVRAEVEAGHEVGVHGWVHTDVYSYPDPSGLPAPVHGAAGAATGSLGEAVDRTVEAVVAAGAPAPAVWRPPYGRVDAPALMVAAERGLDIVLWSHHTPSVAAAERAGQAWAGSVILCHDARSQPSEELLGAVDEAVGTLHERGLTFVTASQMLDGAAGR